MPRDKARLEPPASSKLNCCVGVFGFRGVDGPDVESVADFVEGTVVFVATHQIVSVDRLHAICDCVCVASLKEPWTHPKVTAVIRAATVINFIINSSIVREDCCERS